MMKNKYLFTALLLTVLTVAGIGFVNVFQRMEQEPINNRLHVATSFYPIYIAAINVAGTSEAITLENLSQPQTGCLHDFQLTPQDMISLSEADLFVINGGGMENFLQEVAAEYPDLQILNTSEAVTPLPENAHLWMDMTIYQQQVQSIADGFSQIDEKNAKMYQDNAKNYQKKIARLQAEFQSLTEQVKEQDIIIFHEAFAALATESGLNIAGSLDLDEERQVSAGEIGGVIKLINEKKIKIIFAEALYGKDMGDTIEKETKAKVCYLDTLVRGEYELDSWLNGMKQNIFIIKDALRLNQ